MYKHSVSAFFVMNLPLQTSDKSSSVKGEKEGGRNPTTRYSLMHKTLTYSERSECKFGEIPMLLQDKVLFEDFSVRNFHLWRTVRLEYQLASRRKGRGGEVHRLGSDDVFLELIFQRLPVDEAGNRFHEILLLHPEGALLAEGLHQGLEGMRVARLNSAC